MSRELDYLLSRFVKASSLSGGPLRQAMGEIVEDFVEYVWVSVSRQYPNLQSRIVKGADEPITIFGSFKESVDRHCYINDKLVLAVECKTYLDKCYLQRADSDFSLLKENNKDFSSIIVSLQDSVAKDTFSYFMSRRNIDKIFFFSSVKRSSAPEKHISRNPEWLLENKIYDFINYIKNIFEEENKNGTH